MNTHRPRDARPLAERELHDYQRFCVEFIEAHPQCGVFLDMGLGKTAIALTAVAHLLYDSFEVSRVLIMRRCAWRGIPGLPSWTSGSISAA